MARIRVLFETRYEDRKAYCCADTESNFLILLVRKRTHVDSYVTNDFLFGIGHAHTFLMGNCDLGGLQRHAEETKPIARVETEIISLTPGVVRLDFKTKDELLFTKFFTSELDAQMMGESYLDVLQGWKLAKKAPRTRGLEPLISREKGAHRALVARFQPAGQSGMMGIVLQLYAGEQLIFARFRLFPQAIEQANSLLPTKGGKLTVPLMGEPDQFGPDLETQICPATKDQMTPPKSVLTGYAYSLENIRTVVVRLTEVSHPGFGVLIFVDGYYITYVLKDQDQGGFVYTLPRAIKKAQDLLTQLQGWKSYED